MPAAFCSPGCCRSAGLACARSRAMAGCCCSCRLGGSATRVRAANRAAAAHRPLRQAILFLQAGLTRRVGARIDARRIAIRILLALDAALRDDLAADALRGVDLAHDALIAQRLLRRDHQRHRGEASHGAGPDGKAAGALGEKTKPRAVAAVDLDPPDPAVGVGIKLDRDVAGVGGGRALRHLDQAGGAANAERRRSASISACRRSGRRRRPRTPPCPWRHRTARRSACRRLHRRSCRP